MILDYHDFFHIRNPQCLSIRTLANDSESLDSPNVALSAQLLEEVTRGQVTAIVPKVSKVMLGQVGVDGTKSQVTCLSVLRPFSVHHSVIVACVIIGVHC